MSRPEDPSPTDAAWREIVANFGERAALGDEPASSDHPVEAPLIEVDLSDPEPALPAWLDHEERFVPPVPPKVPRPRSWQRGVAWSGVFVAPAIAMLLVLTTLPVPRLIGWGLVLWCLGGFGYLVATMPRGPSDPWDNGSRV